MQKVFAIIVLLCCAALMGRANEAPPAWVNAVDTNAMKRVLLSQRGLSLGDLGVLGSVPNGFGLSRGGNTGGGLPRGLTPWKSNKYHK